MDSQRQTYRHLFEPQEVLRAELYRSRRPTVIVCEVLDLSLGGMCARLRQQVTSLISGEALVTHLLGRETPPPVELNLSIPSQVVSLVQREEEWHCGIRFLPIADTRANDAIERALSIFLLAEQRRRRMKIQDEANRQR